ncbi:hypothetical protein AK830_g143 [Neonectria ditissima]|uniref:F-box domain-containing protein n=1 Tax=Neonectria ditissima TaxID=78410 RepID=A0A0P7BHC5_9HYPO|nr:hypothetical protein AK830_g143 [Neonectria ditissima]
MAPTTLPARASEMNQGADSTNAKPAPKKTTSFFTLPIEVRLEIYDLLLVSRFRPDDYVRWAQEAWVQKPISPYMLKNLEPQILQVCKRINNEANPILYSQNEFRVTGPVDMLQFMEQMGPQNVKLLGMLQISVPCQTECGSWVKLFDALAKDATGLRALHVEWFAECEYSWEYVRGAAERGLGDNLDFVRALGQIKGLEKMTIRGSYAKRWPAYLQEKMGVRVQAKSGNISLLKCVNVDDEELKEDTGGLDLLRLRNYQQGTKNLIP